MTLPTVVRHRIKQRSTALILFIIIWLTIFIFFCVSIYSLFHLIARYRSSSEPSDLDGLVDDPLLPPMARLKRMVFYSDDLRNRNLTEDFLNRFLAARDNDPKIAFNLVRGYFSLRQQHPEMFMSPSESIKISGDKRMFYFQKERAPSGHFIVYNKPSNWDFGQHELTFAMSSMSPFVELETLNNLESARLGPLTIVDMEGFGFWHVFYARSADTDLLFKLAEQSLPVKTGPIHIVNPNAGFRALFTISKPWMSEQLRNLFTLHSDLEDLYKVIPRELLPKPLGGDCELRTYDEEELEQLDMKLAQFYQRFPANVTSTNP